MSDYTKRFTILIKKDDSIESVINVIGTYEEVESMAHDILDDEGYTFDIIKDQDVFDIASIICRFCLLPSRHFMQLAHGSFQLQ